MTLTIQQIKDLHKLIPNNVTITLEDLEELQKCLEQSTSEEQTKSEKS